MDGEQNVQTSQNPGTNSLAVLFQNKKILLIAAAVVVLFLTIFTVIIRNSARNTGTPQETTSGKNSYPTNAAADGRIYGPSSVPSGAPPTAVYMKPEDAAMRFYEWYTTHPAPLTSGAYKSRTDITDAYKEIMGRYVTRGLSKNRDDIFNCGVYPLPKNVAAQPVGEDVFTNQALVNMYTESNQSLFQIKLQKEANIWLIRDVWCSP